MYLIYFIFFEKIKSKNQADDYFIFFFLVKLGKKHPDPVVETASLSSVEPTDVFYKLSIPNETINAGLLSALQLESITYASQAHDQLLPDGSRAGFLIGTFIFGHTLVFNFIIDYFFF